MIEGKTSTGFKFTIDDDVLDDYELLEAIQGVDDGKFNQIVRVLDLLLGEEQKEKLKEHIRSKSKSKRVSTKAMMDEIGEIFKEAQVKK